MEVLKQRILNDGMALNETVLKVDSFLNHGVDAHLMYNIGTKLKIILKIMELLKSLRLKVQELHRR